MNSVVTGCHTLGCDTNLTGTATLPDKSGVSPEGVSQPPRDTPVTAIQPSEFCYPTFFGGWGRGVTGVTGGRRPIVRAGTHIAHTHPHTRVHEGSPDTRDTRDTPGGGAGNQASHAPHRRDCRHGGVTGGVVTPRDAWETIADTQLTSMTRHTTTVTDAPAHDEIDATGGGEAA